MQKITMEQIDGKLYDLIDESQSSIEDFGNLLLSSGKKDKKTAGEVMIAYNNSVNHSLLKTNLDMLVDQIITPDKNPNKIILLNESYLTKLGAIGNLTLDQIACSLLGKYDPFNPGKKVKLNEIKRVMEEKSGPDLDESFNRRFLGIFNEVKYLRDRAAHSNLAKDILFKGEWEFGKWDSERPISTLYHAELPKNRYGFGKGDLIFNLENGRTSLTDKLNEYSAKYLSMVRDLYKGLTKYRKAFQVKL